MQLRVRVVVMMIVLNIVKLIEVNMLFHVQSRAEMG